MSDNTDDPRVSRAVAGDEAAMAELFDEHRDRLKRMIELRLNRKLHGRVDASDVLQETYVDLAKQLKNYSEDPAIPFFIWLRRITVQRLIMVHRKHLGTAMRDAAMEVNLQRSAAPEASSVFLASHLVGQLTTVSQRVLRDERQDKLREVLDNLDNNDREIIALRHFEHLTIAEIASLYDVTEASAGMRHLRALRKLKKHLGQQPDLFDSIAGFGNERGN